MKGRIGMKKNIGTRIMVMIGILLAVFLVNSISGFFVLQRTADTSREITDVYLEFEEKQVVVSKKVEGLKLYLNLVALLGDEDAETIKGISGSSQEEVNIIETNMDEMERLLVQINNQNLLTTFQSYREQVKVLGQMTVDTGKARLSGDMSKVAKMRGLVYPQVQAIEEEAIKYNDLLSEEIENVKKEMSDRITTNYVISILMLIIL